MHQTSVHDTINSFYMTLLSDRSQTVFPDNTNYCFRTKLPKQISISKEEWELAVVELFSISDQECDGRWKSLQRGEQFIIAHHAEVKIIMKKLTPSSEWTQRTSGCPTEYRCRYVQLCYGTVGWNWQTNRREMSSGIHGSQFYIQHQVFRGGKKNTICQTVVLHV